MFDKSSTIEAFDDEHHEATLVQFKSVFPTYPRDFCMLTFVVKGDVEGTYCIIRGSVEHSSAPARDAYVRGEICFAGTAVRPPPTKKGVSNVTDVVLGDIKGSVPKFMVNMAAKSTPGVATKLAVLLSELKDKVRERAESRL